MTIWCNFVPDSASNRLSFNLVFDFGRGQIRSRLFHDPEQVVDSIELLEKLLLEHAMRLEYRPRESITLGPEMWPPTPLLASLFDPNKRELVADASGLICSMQTDLTGESLSPVLRGRGNLRSFAMFTPMGRLT